MATKSGSYVVVIHARNVGTATMAGASWHDAMELSILKFAQKSLDLAVRTYTMSYIVCVAK